LLGVSSRLERVDPLRGPSFGKVALKAFRVAAFLGQRFKVGRLGAGHRLAAGDPVIGFFLGVEMRRGIDPWILFGAVSAWSSLPLVIARRHEQNRDFGRDRDSGCVGGI
jgi:hypothetical protein